VTIASGLLDDIGGVAKYDEAAVLVNAEGDQLVPLAHDGAERVTWDLARRRSGPFAEAWTTQAKYVRPNRLPNGCRRRAHRPWQRPRSYRCDSAPGR
jgi:hypothetical protein